MSLNIWERACREWLKGCSCASDNNQEECTECTKAFHDHLRNLISQEIRTFEVVAISDKEITITPI